jgi:glycerate kinase
MRGPALVAPDSFKGTLAATEVAAAIAHGLRAVGIEAVELPVADGGEGTLDVLLAALGGELRTATVTDPLGREVEAAFGLLAGDPRRAGRRGGGGRHRGEGRGGDRGRGEGRGGGGRGGGPRRAGDDGATAVVECARASGLDLVAEDERDAFAASTRGTGELIVAAVEAGARRVIVTVGGSATTDGGAGAIAALDETGVKPRLEVWCDTRNPWEAAPRIFGPQKGADPDTVERLKRRLARLAARAPRDPRGVAMTGAAGGLSGGLWAWRGAELIRGAPAVLDAIGFDDRMRDAAFVVTGEGRLDRQTFQGKAVFEVATRARQGGVACHAIVESSTLAPFEERILDLQSAIEAGTPTELEAAGRALGYAISASTTAS